MTKHLLGANLPMVRRQNRSLVLRILLHHGPISRIEICQLTGLTPATISNVVGELLEQQLAVELGAAERQGEQRLGRRRLMVDLNADGPCVVGVYLGVRSIQVGVGDLRGRVLGKVAVPTAARRDPEAGLANVRTHVQALLAQMGIGRARICGVGVASVGLVNSAEGVIVDMPQYGWQQVAAQQYLEGLLDMPVIVENSRRCMATAEAWLGHGQGVESMLLVHNSTTIGGAIVFRGEVPHGAAYAAGQLGHLIVVEDGERCACGHNGCLDTVASGAAIAARAARAAREGRSPVLLEAVGGRPEDMLPPPRLCGSRAGRSARQRAYRTVGRFPRHRRGALRLALRPGSGRADRRRAADGRRCLSRARQPLGQRAGLPAGL